MYCATHGTDRTEAHLLVKAHGIAVPAGRCRGLLVLVVAPELEGGAFYSVIAIRPRCQFKITADCRRLSAGQRTR